MTKQVPVSLPCRPSGAGEMAVEGLSRPIWFALRVDVQHDPRDLSPIGPFRIRIEQAHVGDGMLFIVGGERGIGGPEIGDIRIEGRYGAFSVGTYCG